MKKYIVCMDPYYVRDAQIFQSENYTEEELNRIDVYGETHEDSWRDAEITPYIDFIEAPDEDCACRIVAERFRYDYKSLFGTEVTHFPNAKDDQLNEKTYMTWEEQIKFICDYGKVEDLRFETVKSQLRSLWTSYCIYRDYLIDTAQYDNSLLSIWENGVSQNANNPWEDFDTFENYMCTDLVDNAPFTREDVLFDHMIEYIQELISDCDLRETFRTIGFTDEEMIAYRIGSARKVRFRNLFEKNGDDIQTGILFDDGTVVCQCGCNGTFEEGEYEILADEDIECQTSD